MAFDTMKRILAMMAEQKMQQATPAYQMQNIQLQNLMEQQRRNKLSEKMMSQLPMTSTNLRILQSYKEGGKLAAAMEKLYSERAKKTAADLGIEPDTARELLGEIDKSRTEVKLKQEAAPQLAATEEEIKAQYFPKELERDKQAQLAKAATGEQIDETYFQPQLKREIERIKAIRQANLPFDAYLANLRNQYSGRTGSANPTTLASQWGSMLKTGTFTDSQGNDINDQQFQDIQDYYFENGGQLPEGFRFKRLPTPTTYGGRVVTEKQYAEAKTLGTSWLDDDTNFDSVPDTFRKTTLKGLNNDEEGTFQAIVEGVLSGKDVSKVPPAILEYANQAASYIQNQRTGGRQPMSRGTSGSWGEPTPQTPATPKAVTATRTEYNNAVKALMANGYSQQQAEDYLKTNGVTIVE